MAFSDGVFDTVWGFGYGEGEDVGEGGCEMSERNAVIDGEVFSL